MGLHEELEGKNKTRNSGWKWLYNDWEKRKVFGRDIFVLGKITAFMGVALRLERENGYGWFQKEMGW